MTHYPYQAYFSDFLEKYLKECSLGTITVRALAGVDTLNLQTHSVCVFEDLNLLITSLSI